MSTFLNRESIAFFVCQIWDGSNSTWPVFSGPAWSIDRNWNAGTCWNPKMDQHDLTWSHAQNDRFQYHTHPNPFVVVSSCFISLFKLSHLLHICVEFSNDLPQLSPPERLRYIAVHRGTSPLTAASWCGANTYCRAAVARPGRRRPAATPRHPKSLDLGWKPVAFLGVQSCEESKAVRKRKNNFWWMTIRSNDPNG